jgi:type VI secretion system protein ImpK
MFTSKRKLSPMVISLGALVLALVVYGGLLINLDGTVDTFMNEIKLHMATNTGATP